MTHDAATSYYGETCSWKHLKANYVVTQSPGSLATQLDCGARAFDLRPFVHNGRLIMHHGPARIDHDLASALSDALGWVQTHPDELVLIYGSHCGGTSSDDEARCQNMYLAALKAS